MLETLLSHAEEGDSSLVDGVRREIVEREPGGAVAHKDAPGAGTTRARQIQRS